VEIMIVVAIMIALTTLAIPGILRSRVVTNEAAALVSLRTLNTACQNYHIDEQGYPGILGELSTATPPYIDSVLGSGTKQGYQFIYELGADPEHFIVNADPTGLLKGRYFYMDESGIIRSNNTTQASPDDEVIK
jgi:type IV pilus assembly protein PilA